jgi:hypothetical protein
MLKGGLFEIFFMYDIQVSTLLHLQPLRFHCVGGCLDRTQDSCDYTALAVRRSLTTRLDLIHS